MMQKNKICFVTTTRAEYGLLYWTMRGVQESSQLELQLVVTGTHTERKYGSTIDLIKNDNFQISKTIPILSGSDRYIDISKACARALSGFAEAFEKLRPDIVVLLGDRYELLGIAAAAFFMRVPIFHLHGGEVTQGAIDDSIRHSITKLASWHGAAALPYAKRLVQLGEDPATVYVVGAPGLDFIKKLTPIPKSELEESLGLSLRARSIVCSYHPETQAEDDVAQLKALLSVLHELENTTIIFTHPNSDPGREQIVKLLEKFVDSHPTNSCIFESLGQTRYISALHYVDAMVGNSSSGILEAPALKLPAINIGKRQFGRLRASSVIDVEPNTGAIRNAFKHLYSERFQSELKNCKSLYGDGNTTDKLLKIFAKILGGKERFRVKKFYDVNFTVPEIGEMDGGI